MSKIDYFGIEEEIKRILDAAIIKRRTKGKVKVTIEENFNQVTDNTPWEFILIHGKPRQRKNL